MKEERAGERMKKRTGDEAGQRNRRLVNNVDDKERSRLDV